MSKNKSLLVHVIKSYNYPLSSLGKDNPHKDAAILAHKDMLNEIQHIVNNDFNHGFPDNFFNIEVEEHQTSHLRDTIKQQYTGGRGNFVEKIKIKTATEVITKLLFEQKYGIMDQNKNPDIYEPKHKNLLKAEPGNYFNDTYEQIYRMLRKANLTSLYQNRYAEF